jgi:hypothetical protein
LAKLVITRDGIANSVRRLLRQVEIKPLTPDHIFDAMEDAVDDICSKVPFHITKVDLSTVRDTREIALPMDTLEVIEVSYANAAGTTLDVAIVDAEATTPITVVSTADFTDTGTIVIGTERIAYTGKTATTFTGITRGADDTTAATHLVDANVIEPDVPFTRIDPTTLRDLGDSDNSYLNASPGIPAEYYVDTGILGFDVPPEKSGYQNVKLRLYSRPDAIPTGAEDGDEELTWLPHGLRKAFKYKVASILATVLGQDTTAMTQGQLWNQEFLFDVARFIQNRHTMERGLESRITPITGRV